MYKGVIGLDKIDDTRKSNKGWYDTLWFNFKPNQKKFTKQQQKCTKYKFQFKEIVA